MSELQARMFIFIFPTSGIVSLLKLMETFREIQTLRNAWALLVLLPVLTVSIWGICTQIFPDEIVRPVNGTLLTVSLTGCIGSLIFLTVSMETQVDDAAITVTFRPFFITKKILREEITGIEIVQFNRLYEFGQFGSVGIRYGRNGLKGYLMSGQMGILIKTKEGDKILIGTQKPRTVSTLLKNLTVTPS